MENPDITDAEMSVMNALWENEGGMTVREIVMAMYGRHEHSLHAGVKSFLDRLMEKRLVSVDKSGFSHCFRAAVSRSKFVGSQLKQIAESHFGGAIAPMLMSIVQQTSLTRKERAAIEEAINKLK